MKQPRGRTDHEKKDKKKRQLKSQLVALLLESRCCA
jgi:hypothetical protein